VPGSASDTMEGVLAAILESGDLERLYTGLSLLVSAASDGRPARGLAKFGALEPLLDPQLEGRALRPENAPHVTEPERAAFARTLAELRDAAVALPDCRIWACAAAVQATGADWAVVSERLEGVISTPQFLRDVAGAQLVVV
jgi:peroxiredoxin family protein